MLLMLIVAFTTFATSGIQGCEHDKILACVNSLQEHLSTTRFIINHTQLKAYCDKMANAHACILNQSHTCQSEVRSSYAEAVKAEQDVIRHLCQKGAFQDDYLREATCIWRIYSEQNQGACSKDYSKLVAYAFDSRSREKMHNPETLQNMCCAYYAVHKCTQTHAARCEGRTATKSPIRQIYKGLDHNCKPFKAACPDKSSGTRAPTTHNTPRPKPPIHHPPKNIGAGPKSFSSRSLLIPPPSVLLAAVVVAVSSTVISLAATP